MPEAAAAAAAAASRLVNSANVVGMDRDNGRNDPLVGANREAVDSRGGEWRALEAVGIDGMLLADVVFVLHSQTDFLAFYHENREELC